MLLLVLFGRRRSSTSARARRVDFLAPGVLALAVLSTAFTGQAIATGFERRYGVLKRLGATPLPGRGCSPAKTLTVLWSRCCRSRARRRSASRSAGARTATPPAAVLLVLLGTAAFSGLGLLMAGTLRAEATLAAANLVYLLLLVAAAWCSRWRSSAGRVEVVAAPADRRARPTACARACDGRRAGARPGPRRLGRRRAGAARGALFRWE